MCGIGLIFSDSDLEDAEIKKCITSVEKKGATMRQKKVKLIWLKLVNAQLLPLNSEK